MEKWNVKNGKWNCGRNAAGVSENNIITISFYINTIDIYPHFAYNIIKKARCDIWSR